MTGCLGSLLWASGFSDKADNAIKRVDGSGKDGSDGHCLSVTEATVQ